MFSFPFSVCIQTFFPKTKKKLKKFCLTQGWLGFVVHSCNSTTRFQLLQPLALCYWVSSVVNFDYTTTTQVEYVCGNSYELCQAGPRVLSTGVLVNFCRSVDQKWFTVRLNLAVLEIYENIASETWLKLEATLCKLSNR